MSWGTIQDLIQTRQELTIVITLPKTTVWMDYKSLKFAIWYIRGKNINDPSAGSPTETLLRLLLPLNDQVDQFPNWLKVEPTNTTVPEATNPFNR